MKLKLEEMRAIARTLPVGYYMGRKVPVFVEEGNAAYCDPVKSEIHIGLGLLQIAADNVNDESSWDREKMLRCLLYHEVGHLLLSPKCLKSECCPELPDGRYDPDGADLVNVFEDERLEQMLSSVFMGVDFKKFVELVHKGGVGDSRVGKFLSAVRLRRTTPQISAAVDDAIKELAGINATTGSWSDLRKYRDKLTELVGMIAPYEKPKPESEKPKQQSKQSAQGKSERQSGRDDSERDDSDQDKSEQDDSERNESGEDKPNDGKSKQDKPEGGGKSKDESKDGEGEGDGKSEKDGSEDETPDEGGESKGLDADDGASAEKSEESPDGQPAKMQKPKSVNLPTGFLKKLAEKVFVTPTQDVQSTLRRFAVRLSKKKGAQAAGRWSAMSGRIDARRDALDKERIFRRRSDVGASLLSSIHLTLWVDTSGSFHASEGILNRILAATSAAVAMVGGKLTVDVVKMGSGAKVARQNEWRIRANGGNDLNASYADAFRRTRRKDRRNIDIIVFDGECDNAVCYHRHYNGQIKMIEEVRAKGAIVDEGREKKIREAFEGAKRKLAAKLRFVQGWNHPDCHVISDPSNAPIFDEMKKAHVTYVSGGYAERLQGEVIKTLDRIL